MKKILSVMLAILMMASLTACQTVEDFRDGLAHITGTETEPPSAFTPTVTPEAETAVAVATEPKPDEKEIKKETEELTCNVALGNGLLVWDKAQEITVDYIAKYCPHEKYDSFQTPVVLQYAIFPLKGDFTEINTELRPEMYELPYNFACSYNGDKDSLFLNNRYTIEHFGAEQVEEWAKKAKRIAEINKTCNPNEDTKALYTELLTLFPQSEAERIIESGQAEQREYGISQICRIETDPSMVYVAADGFVRVRITQYLKVLGANDKYYADGMAETLVNEKEWFYEVVEMVLGLDENYDITDVSMYQLTEYRQCDAATAAKLDEV